MTLLTGVILGPALLFGASQSVQDGLRQHSLVSQRGNELAAEARLVPASLGRGEAPISSLFFAVRVATHLDQDGLARAGRRRRAVSVLIGEVARRRSRAVRAVLQRGSGAAIAELRRELRRGFPGQETFLFKLGHELRFGQILLLTFPRSIDGILVFFASSVAFGRYWIVSGEILIGRLACLLGDLLDD